VPNARSTNYVFLGASSNFEGIVLNINEARNKNYQICLVSSLEWGRGRYRCAPMHLSTLYLPPSCFFPAIVAVIAFAPQNSGSALIHSSFT